MAAGAIPQTSASAHPGPVESVELFAHAVGLFLDGLDPCREQAIDAKRFPLGRRECGPFVQRWVVEQ